jgi:hypothetical protein
LHGRNRVDGPGSLNHVADVAPRFCGGVLFGVFFGADKIGGTCPYDHDNDGQNDPLILKETQGIVPLAETSVLFLSCEAARSPR